MSQAGEEHDYLSTACEHGQCKYCRKTCKYCNAPCRCTRCHGQAGAAALPVPWIDQARDLAAELLAVLGDSLPAELKARIAGEDFFWARGEVQPDGVHPDDG